MSIRRAFQIAAIVLALAFSFGATSITATAGGCPPTSPSGGLC